MSASESEEIIKNAEARLEKDTRVNLDRSRVKVSAEGNQLILTGQMESIAEKRAAFDTVARLIVDEAPWSIIDRLHIRAADEKEDNELGVHVESALVNERVFRDYTLTMNIGGEVEVLHDGGADDQRIEATVGDGAVSLSGVVQSLSHKRLAEVLMWWIDGCRFVDNQLEVLPPEEDTDDEITDVVRMVLEKDPLVHAGQFFVRTAGGVVVMNGSAASSEEKRLAIMDAWTVPGVADVVDQVESRG